MIVCQRQKLIVITPPKTGSTSLHNELCRSAPDCLPVYTLDPEGSVSKHGVVVPVEFATVGYRVAVVVRDPLDRLVSQYTHWSNWQTSQGLAAPSLLDFLTSPPDSFVFGWNLTRTLAGVRYDTVWRLETLNKHLDAEGLPTVGRSNASWHRATNELLTGELKRLALERSADDNSTFGYPLQETSK